MIVLDTNALMMPVECDVRVFEEIERVVGDSEAVRAPAQPSGESEAHRSSESRAGSEATREQSHPGGLDLVVPRAVVAELEKLSGGAGEEATAASVGLDLAERCRVAATDADYADDAVLELAGQPDATHAVTNDKPLKRRLLDAGVPVIGLRGQHKLAITQP